MKILANFQEQKRHELEELKNLLWKICGIIEQSQQQSDGTFMPANA